MFLNYTGLRFEYLTFVIRQLIEHYGSKIDFVVGFGPEEINLRSQISDLGSRISDLRSQISDLRFSDLKSRIILDLRSQISDLG
jgi:hypothetical protein